MIAIKKKLTAILFWVSLPLLAFADGIAEEDLTGTWILESSEGDFVYLRNNCKLARPDVIEFYDELIHTQKPESLGVARFQSPSTYTIGIQDYFIYDCSNGRLRLHIQYSGGHYIMRYIVNHIDANRMELETYDHLGKVTYIREDASAVRETTATNETSETKSYALSGIPVTAESKTSVIVSKGKKVVKKN